MLPRVDSAGGVSAGGVSVSRARAAEDLTDLRVSFLLGLSADIKSTREMNQRDRQSHLELFCLTNSCVNTR